MRDHIRGFGVIGMLVSSTICPTALELGLKRCSDTQKSCYEWFDLNHLDMIPAFNCCDIAQGG